MERLRWPWEGETETEVLRATDRDIRETRSSRVREKPNSSDPS